MKKIAAPAKLSHPAGNSFATKTDLKKLEKKMDLRFEQVDKRFEQVDDRFRWFRMEIKDDLEQFKKDTFSEFDSRWINRIDPILAEIEKHREKEVLWAEQNVRTERKVDSLDSKVSGLDDRVSGLDDRVSGLDSKVSSLDSKVSILDSKVSSLDSKVSSLDSQMGKMGNKVSSLDSQMGKMGLLLGKVAKKVGV